MSFNPLLGTKIPWRRSCSSSLSSQSQGDSWRKFQPALSSGSLDSANKVLWIQPKFKVQVLVQQWPLLDKYLSLSGKHLPMPISQEHVYHEKCINSELKTPPRNSLLEIVRSTCRSSDCPTFLLTNVGWKKLAHNSAHNSSNP